METDRRLSVEFERCTSCSGVWIDRFGLAQILDSPAYELDWKGRPAELDEGRETELSCGACGDKLVARQAKGIELDVCRGCGGLFFDATELEALRVATRRESRGERLENAAEGAEDLVGNTLPDMMWEVLAGAIRNLLG